MKKNSRVKIYHKSILKPLEKCDLFGVAETSIVTIVTLCLAQLVPGWVTVFGQVGLSHVSTESGTQVYSA